LTEVKLSVSFDSRISFPESTLAHIVYVSGDCVEKTATARILSLGESAGIIILSGLKVMAL